MLFCKILGAGAATGVLLPPNAVPAPPVPLKTAFLSVPRGFWTVSGAVGRGAAGFLRQNVSNRPARRDKNVFFRPFSPRGGIKTFFSARSARAEE